MRTGLLFNRQKVPVLQNEIVLERYNSGDSRVWVHFISVCFAIVTMIFFLKKKVAKTTTFMVCEAVTIKVSIRRKTQSSWNMANLSKVIGHYVMLL